MSTLYSSFRRRLYSERPVAVVPVPVIAVLCLAFALQVAWHYHRESPLAEARKLPAPPSQQVLKAASLGEAAALSRILMLWLQAFDNQPSISIPFSQLDYGRVIQWLERIAGLDRRSQYPYLTAARVYAEVQDNEKRRRMLEFVHRGFQRDPLLQWPAMSHAVFVAKHRIRDLDMALEYARDLRIRLKDADVPSWVKQMELFVLEDKGDLESAKILLGGFLDSGVIEDEREFRFLQDRLGIAEKEKP